MPDLVTTSWWKEERGERIFVDFNQACRDRTIASAYSPRPLPGAPVRLSTGVVVMYADAESITFMTPEGHTLYAWITISAARGRARSEQLPYPAHNSRVMPGIG